MYLSEHLIQRMRRKQPLNNERGPAHTHGFYEVLPSENQVLPLSQTITIGVQMHPLLHPARCIVPCITVHQICQLNPHVLIQSMGISFCIYRPINRQNTGYNYQIWAIDARNGLLCVILSDGSFHFPPFFSLLMAAFRGRNQRFIMECTLLWTIAGYRPQCEVSSKVSRNSA